MKFIFESNPVKLNLPSNVDYEWVIFKDLTGAIIPHDREKENIFLPLIYVGQLIEYTLVPNTITIPIEHPLAYIERLQKFLNILNIEKPSTADLTRSRFFERYNIPTKYNLTATKVLITNKTDIAYNDLIDAGYDASEGEWFVSYNDNVFVRGFSAPLDYFIRKS